MLITAVGGDIGLSVLKCLRESGRNAHIVGVDMDEYAAGRDDVDEFYRCPPAKRKKEYLNFLEELLKKGRYDYIVPISEAEMSLLNRNRDHLKAYEGRLLMNDGHVVSTFLDKYKTVKFLKDNGLPYPETFLPSDKLPRFTRPLVIKQRTGSGSRGFLKVEDAEGMRFHLKRRRDSIVQEYLSGEEYTAGLFGDGNIFRSIIFKRKLGYGGLSRTVELAEDERLGLLLERIGRACGLRGSINVQLKLTSKGFVPFEINPRLSSTVYFRHRFGFKDVVWWLNLLDGKPVRYIKKYTQGVGVRKISEVFFDIK
jgi:carbamoyl-phosphate synthase large subunit